MFRSDQLSESMVELSSSHELRQMAVLTSGYVSVCALYIMRIFFRQVTAKDRQVTGNVEHEHYGSINKHINAKPIIMREVARQRKIVTSWEKKLHSTCST